VRVSFVLLLTPFIFACLTVTPITRSRSFTFKYSRHIERGGASEMEQSIPKHLRYAQGRIQVTALGVKHEVKMRTVRGKLNSANVIEEHYGSVKDEWAIIGTADETHTKACGRGQRPDGSKVYGGWLYLYLGCLISNSFT
jgi:hypothetical protein